MISSSTSLDVRKARDILFVQKALWKMIPLAIQRAAVGSCWSLQRQSRPSRDAITLAHEIEVWLGERITQRDVVSIEDLRQVTHALREELHTYQPLTGEQLLVLFGAISVLTLYVLSAWSL